MTARSARARAGLATALLVLFPPALRAAPVTNALGQLELHLPDAVDMALRLNRDLARAGIGIEDGTYGLAVADAGFSIRYAPVGTASTSSSGDQFEAGMRANRKNLLGQDFQLRVSAEQDSGEDSETVQRGRVGLQVTQPLFRNFGRLVNEEPLVRARSELRRSRRAYENEINNLIVRVAETFLNIIRLERRIVTDDAFLTRTERLLELTRLRERQGRSSRVDTLRVSLQRGEAAARVQQSRERLHLARLDFLDLIGAGESTAVVLHPPPEETFAVPAPPEAVATAFSNRLDYAQAIDDALDRARGVRLARKNLQPDLAVVARYDRFGEGADAGDATAFDHDEWFVGLGAIRELNPALEAANLGRAELDLRAAREDLAIQAMAIRRRVQQQITSCNSTRQELEIAARNRVLAKSRADLAQKLFRIGRGDNFAVTDAEEAFLQAEAAWQDAQADWLLSAYRLRQELGTLREVPPELLPRAPAKAELLTK